MDIFCMYIAIIASTYKFIYQNFALEMMASPLTEQERQIMADSWDKYAAAYPSTIPPVFGWGFMRHSPGRMKRGIFKMPLICPKTSPGGIFPKRPR